MHEVNLGKLARNSSSRDAVHIAVIPMIANEDLFQGQHVGVIDLDKNLVGPTSDNIGIVDPFLDEGPLEGELFWVMLYPQTITSLRHDWVHPAFQSKSENAKMEVAIEFIKESASICNTTMDNLLEIIRNNIENDDFEYDNTESYKNVNWEVFWKCYEIYTGEKIDDPHVPYSCSC